MDLRLHVEQVLYGNETKLRRKSEIMRTELCSKNIFDGYTKEIRQCGQSAGFEMGCCAVCVSGIGTTVGWAC